MDLVDKIIELTDLFDDNVLTTADKIPQPEPRKDVVDREAINRFMRDNPPGMADGGRMGFGKGTQKTSSVKTDVYKFPVNTGGGMRFAKKKRSNQFTENMRTFTEVKKAIKDAPPKIIRGKEYPLTKKDLVGQGEYYKNKIVTKNELKRFPKLNIPGEGKPITKPSSKLISNKKYMKFIKDAQGGHIGFDKLTNFSHFAPKLKSYLVSTANTGPLKASVNRAAEGYDAAILKIAQEQEKLILKKPKNYKKLLLAKNKEAADTAKNFEKLLPKELKGTLGYFKVSPNGKFNLKGVDKSKTFAGAKGEEKFYKDMTATERKAFGKAEFEKIKNNPKFRAKIPGITDLLEMAGSIPDDIKRAKYLKAGFKTLGVAVSPLVIYDTYKAFEQGKPILESLEQGLIGTDLIGGTKRILSLTPEEKKARSVVKQDAIQDLNLDMPMGFGYIEGPTPKTDMTLEEAQAIAAAGDKRVRELETQKNFERATDRSNFFGNLRDQIFGAPQSLSFAGGGIAGLSGGDKSGAMLESMNPDSQGLRSLKKRVKTI